MKNSFVAVCRVIAVFTVISILAVFVVGIPLVQKEKTTAEEPMKAVWISYIDLRQVDFSTEESFRKDIDNMFTNCRDTGLNTVIVQVRPFGDALYRSDIYPYSHIITGIQGQAPGYDPLEIMTALAHSKGLRIDAWVNPYRAKQNSQPGGFSRDNPANNTAITVSTGIGIYYNPALQQVRDMVTAGVVEIVENYDVDGIHIDDYFYPSTEEYIDSAEYAVYGGSLSLADWRRENVNMLVRQMYSAIKKADSNVTFGISPQGNNYNNYNVQYSDVVLWLGEKGYCDYIMPQLYWGFDYITETGSDRFSFDKLCSEWAGLPRADGVKLYVGLGAYRIGAGENGNRRPEWQRGDNLARMAWTADTYSGIDGWALYSYGNLFNNTEYPRLRAAETANIRGYVNPAAC